MSGRPLVGECIVCGTLFDHPKRKQGGGQRKKYCSPKCRSLDWCHNNGEKRQASIVKYDTKLESIEAKQLRTRKALLRKYGWTEADFQYQLRRQNYSCGGCLKPIDNGTARIDHCHKTNRVRGLLCDHCNWGLGHLRDDETVLRRLMAYMDRDLTQTSVYLVGALKNPRIPEIGNVLRSAGHDVMDEWFTPGKDADTNWQEYERLRGRSYEEALRGRSATNCFLFDRAYLDCSDVVVLVMPAGKSAMLELGYAKGRGKPTCLFLDGADPERYDIMPNFADAVVFAESELLSWVGGARA